MTRTLSRPETEFGMYLCARRADDHTTNLYAPCDICRADIVRLVNGVPAGEATMDAEIAAEIRREERARYELAVQDWGVRVRAAEANAAALLAKLANLAALQPPAPLIITAPQVLPTRAEVEAVIEEYGLAMYWENELRPDAATHYSERTSNARTALLSLIPTRDATQTGGEPAERRMAMDAEGLRAALGRPAPEGGRNG